MKGAPLPLQHGLRIKVVTTPLNCVCDCVFVPVDLCVCSITLLAATTLTICNSNKRWWLLLLLPVLPLLPLLLLQFVGSLANQR